ncbi:MULTISPECIES: response regulator [unclassified Bradyrhizobium]|jgi:ActR/RegA family two-component response regulator|uniref:response regulator n=1 Tax=unclassified Bradyrhizobium TaxID=2631580 RepID=UPI0004B2F080|nr:MULTISPECIES: response regulator [unclassified Bradyrhizobium]
MTSHGQPTVCRVLIVEDEYFLGDDLARSLRSLGFQVIGPVSELPDAMAIQHPAFDVAVIDINLRGDSAYPMADKLTRAGKPFVFATGYGAAAIPHRFEHVPRWEKPYDVAKLSDHVRELCAEQSPNAAAE